MADRKYHKEACKSPFMNNNKRRAESPAKGDVDRVTKRPRTAPQLSVSEALRQLDLGRQALRYELHSSHMVISHAEIPGITRLVAADRFHVGFRAKKPQLYPISPFRRRLGSAEDLKEGFVSTLQEVRTRLTEFAAVRPALGPISVTDSMTVSDRMHELTKLRGNRHRDSCYANLHEAYLWSDIEKGIADDTKRYNNSRKKRNEIPLTAN